MSIFWALMSAISTSTSSFMTRCPKCSAKMTRVKQHDQGYMTSRKAAIVPIFDVCTECGHRIRRRNMRVGFD